MNLSSKFEEALQNMKMKYDIDSKILSADHPQIADDLKFIDMLEKRLQQNEQE